MTDDRLRVSIPVAAGISAVLFLWFLNEGL